MDEEVMCVPHKRACVYVCICVCVCLYVCVYVCLKISLTYQHPWQRQPYTRHSLLLVAPSPGLQVLT
jgi:hypothetical protein